MKNNNIFVPLLSEYEIVQGINDIIIIIAGWDFLSFMRINLVIGLGSFLISHTLIMMSSPQNEMFLST